MVWQAGMQTDRQTDRHTGRQTYRQTDRQTCKHISGVPLIIWKFLKTEVRECTKYD